MARLRDQDKPRPAAELPAALRRENVTVEMFVPAWEQPPPYAEDVHLWRRIRAMRRWQDAVLDWGHKHGLDRSALMSLSAWPARPPDA